MKKQATPFGFLKKPLPFYVTAILVLSSILITSAIIKIERKNYYSGINSLTPDSKNSNTTEESHGNILLLRRNGNKFIQPILFASSTGESQKLSELKASLSDSVNKMLQDGRISEASVYVDRLNDGDWIDINSDKTFKPRSLIKVPILITYLKMAETDPSVLKRTYYYSKADSNVPVQQFSHKVIKPGKLYNTKELMQEMIINSDNYATLMLFQHIDTVALKQLFGSLQIDCSALGKMEYQINTSDYSKFFQLLYNGTYLTLENSEFALSLLTKTDFKIGLCKQLPPDILVAHKFGENNTEDSKQLHESGIIYLGNNPYLITIMTKGNDLSKLPEVISNLSKVAFDYMQTNN